MQPTTPDSKDIPAPPPELIGRDAEFEQVVRFLRGEGPDELVVSGMPGVGKTFLVECAVRAAAVPFDLRTPENMKRASPVHATERVRIFENVDHVESIRTYGDLFESHCGIRRILVTRDPTLGRATGKLQLQPLTARDSRRLLDAEMERQDLSDTGGVEALLEVVGGVPLSICLAVHRLAFEPGLTARALADRIRAGRDSLPYTDLVRGRLFEHRRWNRLQDAVLDALEAFTEFFALHGLDFDELEALQRLAAGPTWWSDRLAAKTAGLSAVGMGSCIEALWRSGLLGQSVDGQDRRYTLYPFARYFLAGNARADHAHRSGRRAEPLDGCVHLQTVSLRDWRGFQRFDLNLQPAADPGTGQWAFLLGENGCGKTSVLRALALALVSDEVGEALLGLAGLASPHVRLDAAEARVEVALTAGPLPATVVKRARESEIMPPRTASRLGRPFVVAYGCRRGTSLGGADREVEFRPIDAVRTLFEEGASLIHAETWLRRWALAAAQEPDSPKSTFYEAILKVLVGLLPGVEQVEVLPERVWVTGPGVGRVPLGALSDGYLTTTGWILDMVARWSEHAQVYKLNLDGDFAARMSGVALVDEVDLHLHPRWQREIIDHVRAAFPCMTFVVTTHNPVTLLDARPGEVLVLTRSNDGAVGADQRDIPPGIGLDRLLTGAWFGLPTVLDDDTLALLEQERALLASGEPADAAKRVALREELRRRLGRHGDTSLERMAESVAAEVLEELARPAQELSAEQREQARATIRARLLARARGESTGGA